MNTDDIIKALANPVRRDILNWLKDPQTHFPNQEHPLELGVCAGQIDQRAGLSQSTVSSHLAILQRAGLIASRRVGQWVYYRRNEYIIQTFLENLQRDL
ncbi:ArsR/SmtB family transcription factor [Paludibacterium yongneupense]|uniref:ArsR/SmtB family transcription factor n=1 Tax=Paludibacterium yongneupense TaxID=400061 RepID=UPI00041E1022|nr:helix-turn-helix transcriptional regulator [Paludibacterium yongneupense]